MKEEILRMERVTCRIKGKTELQDVSLRITEGEIVGLIPINTYGLESLLAILLNNEPIYYGYVYYCEECINSWRNEKRRRNPVTLIDGNPALVEGMSVALNLYAFRSDSKDEILREKQMRAEITPYLEDLDPGRFGITILPDTLAEKLSTLQSVVVEIMRAYMLGHRLIILREISSVLSEEQVLVLSKVMRHYADRGCAFLYISMHMEEIRQICTKVAVFTNGSVDMVADLNKGEGGALEQSAYLVYADGLYRSVSGTLASQEQEHIGDTLLEIRTESIPSGIRVRKGECLAVQFLDTRPYQEIVDSLSHPQNGKRTALYLSGIRITGRLNRKVAVLKENAAQTMIFSEMSVLDNLCMTADHRLPEIWRRNSQRRMIRQEYVRLTEHDPFTRNVNELSREERTELVYMRIYMQRPEVLIIEQPFKGADVPMKQRIWELIELLISEGVTVVLLTVNMADSLALASRAIRVGSHGQTEEYERDSFSELPDNLPWTVLYRDRENLARSGAMHKESEEAHCRKEVENERLHRT